MKWKDPARGLVKVCLYDSGQAGVLVQTGESSWSAVGMPAHPVGARARAIKIRKAIRYAVQRDRARSGKRR